MTRPNARQRFDWLGAGLFFVGLLSFLAALTYGQESGIADPLVGLGLVVSAVSLVAFVAVERRVSQPMVDLTLFGNPNFSANLATGFIQFVTIAGVLILLPFYLENTLGYSIRQVGMLLAAIPITLGILAPISGHLSDRMGTRPVTVAGLTVSTIGFALAASLYGVDTGPIQFIAAGLVIGAGIGLFQSPNNSAILGAVPANRLGITSGMLTINRITGQIVGIAVLGTIWAARTTSYAGGGTAESAAPRYQAAGLRDTFIVATFLLVVAIGIAVAAWRREARAGSLLDG